MEEEKATRILVWDKRTKTSGLHACFTCAWPRQIQTRANHRAENSFDYAQRPCIRIWYSEIRRQFTCFRRARARFLCDTLRVWPAAGSGAQISSAIHVRHHSTRCWDGAVATSLPMLVSVCELAGGCSVGHGYVSCVSRDNVLQREHDSFSGGLAAM